MNAARLARLNQETPSAEDASGFSALRTSTSLWSSVRDGGKRRVVTLQTLDFGRCDLEKGVAPTTRFLFVIGVDPRLDYLSGIRCGEDVALERRMISSLRQAKPRPIAASDRDLPHCH
jgi:hypothetical protein